MSALHQVSATPIRTANARSILSPVSGFLREAAFTHSLTPARNCTYGCTYCYVPTMRVYGGLKREDWENWGRWTTLKANAAELLQNELRPDQVIYCSPLVDPYQPAEAEARLMPGVWEALLRHPPRVFVLQTRGTLALRDIDLLREIAERTQLRVSFSVTTDCEEIRRLYEPHCEPNSERLDAIARLRDAGIEAYATLAPLLPCDPENLARLALGASGRDLIGDPLHVRSAKPRGATSRDAAFRIAEVQGHREWFEEKFQQSVIERIGTVAEARGKRFEVGPKGFGRLARIQNSASTRLDLHHEQSASRDPA
jgi:DNA repair photolyase